MNDPERLIVSSKSETARLLLGSAREEAPSAARQRTWLAATGALATGVTATTATTATAGKALSLAKMWTALSLKWICVAGLVSVGMAVGGGAALRAVNERQLKSERADTGSRGGSIVDTPSGLAASAPRSGATAAGVPLTDIEPGSAVVGAPQPSAISPTSTPANTTTPANPNLNRQGAALRGSGTGTRAVAPETSMAAELAMLDTVRSAIDGRRPDIALAILQDHTRQFPHGVLAPEATLLRIEALAAAGDQHAARRAASTFLRANPDTPYAARIRALVGEDVATPR